MQEKKPMPSGMADAMRAFGLLSGVGIYFVVFLGIFLFLGQCADDFLGTGRVCTITGILLGFPAGVTPCVWDARRSDLWEIYDMGNKTVNDVMQKMIAYSEGNLHDIAHFMKVYAFTRTIGVAENLTPTEQETVEIAAILHDIACPLCREKYGNTNGNHQEEEGGPLTEEFLKDIELPAGMAERLVYLVSHHHTYNDVDGRDYQILLEADFLVNADESHMGAAAIRNFRDHVFKTATGTHLLETIYL